MLEFTSENSIWDIDEEKMVYRRTPKRGGIVHVGSPRMEYGVWHPLLDFIVSRPWLIIRRTDATRGLRTFIGFEEGNDN